MKTKIFSFFILVFSCFMFTSCEQMISDVDVPEYSPKLVVFCYISPSDSLIVVRVSKSKAVFGIDTEDPDYYNVSNATVVISDGMNTKTIPYYEMYQDQDVNAYILPQRDFGIVTGLTYHLEVSAPGGFKVKASCTVPPAPVTDVVVDRVDSVLQDQVWQYKIGFHFTDIPGRENQYRLQSFLRYTDPFFHDTVVQQLYFELGELLVSDAGRDGDDYAYITNAFSIPEFDDNNFLISLYSVDYNYYTFHKEAMIKGDYDDPFSEPVIMISNIEGGLGLFAAYNKRDYSFSVPH